MISLPKRIAMQKLRRHVSVLLLICISIGVSSARAQSPTRLSSTPKTFQSFYAKFRRAVIRGDKQAVASMTTFPFSYGWDAGDEGTYGRRQFLQKFKDIFRGAASLFRRSDPKFTMDATSLVLTNTADASHYVFEKKHGIYHFASFIVEP